MVAFRNPFIPKKHNASAPIDKRGKKTSVLLLCNCILLLLVSSFQMVSAFREPNRSSIQIKLTELESINIKNRITNMAKAFYGGDPNTFLNYCHPIIFKTIPLTHKSEVENIFKERIKDLHKHLTINSIKMTIEGAVIKDYFESNGDFFCIVEVVIKSTFSKKGEIRKGSEISLGVCRDKSNWKFIGINDDSKLVIKIEYPFAFNRIKSALRSLP